MSLSPATLARPTAMASIEPVDMRRAIALLRGEIVSMRAWAKREPENADIAADMAMAYGAAITVLARYAP